MTAIKHRLGHQPQVPGWRRDGVVQLSHLHRDEWVSPAPGYNLSPRRPGRGDCKGRHRVKHLESQTVVTSTRSCRSSVPGLDVGPWTRPAHPGWVSTASTVPPPWTPLCRLPRPHCVPPRDTWQVSQLFPVITPSSQGTGGTKRPQQIPGVHCHPSSAFSWETYAVEHQRVAIPSVSVVPPGSSGDALCLQAFWVPVPWTLYRLAQLLLQKERFCQNNIPTVLGALPIVHCSLGEKDICGVQGRGAWVCSLPSSEDGYLSLLVHWDAEDSLRLSGCSWVPTRTETRCTWRTTFMPRKEESLQKKNPALPASVC